MKKAIQQKIEISRIKAEFQIELLPRRRGRGKAQQLGYVKRFHRNENLDVIDSDGNIVLSQVHAERTLTPKEQYLKSALNPYRKEN